MAPTVDVLRERLRALLNFRWVDQGYGRRTCRSCGAQSCVDYDEDRVTETREPCSRSCPWRLAEEALVEDL